MERDFQPLICDRGCDQQQQRNHPAAKNVTRRVRQPHYDCPKSGERNRDRIETFSLFAHGHVGIAPSAGTDPEEKQNTCWRDHGEKERTDQTDRSAGSKLGRENDANANGDKHERMPDPGNNYGQPTRKDRHGAESIISAPAGSFR